MEIILSYFTDVWSLFDINFSLFGIGLNFRSILTSIVSFCFIIWLFKIVRD